MKLKREGSASSPQLRGDKRKSHSQTGIKVVSRDYYKTLLGISDMISAHLHTKIN